MAELWLDIFHQTKPSLSGYGGVDLVTVREVLKIHGLELTEDLYKRIKFVEDLYKVNYAKEVENVT